MTAQQLRVLYALEFLVALPAIFTAWSEIGTQDALDLMHWGWKAGLAAALAVTTVGLTAAVAAQERVLTMRSARWLAALVVCLLLTGIVTYYYALQVDTGDSEEHGIVSSMSIERLMLSNRDAAMAAVYG